MLTTEHRKAIDPDFCSQGLQSILRRFGMQMENDELASIYGAISLLVDKPVEEWVFREAVLLKYDELFKDDTFCVWYEDNEGTLCQVAYVDYAYMDRAVNVSVRDNDINKSVYGSAWRMWLTRPSDSQREKTPWGNIEIEEEDE